MIEFFQLHRELIAQIIGFIAMAIVVITYQCKSQRKILILLMVSAFVWCVHFLVLGKYTAVLLNLLSAFRCVIYACHSDGKKWAQGVWIPIVFGIVCSVSTIFTWGGLIDILPLVSTFMYTYSNWQQNERRLKYITLPASMCWLVYNIVGGSVAGAINEGFAEISIIVYLVRTRKKGYA